MKKLLTSAALICVAAVPATASAADAPTPAQFKNASKFCKALKSASGSNFSSLYKNHGKCVSTIAKSKAKKDDQQAAEAKSNASKTCKAERGDTAASRAAFNAKYGQKGNGIGKCVSQQQKAERTEAEKQEKAEDQNRVNAAKQCKTERGSTTASKEAFALKYGTNKNRKNAFGKCVSKTAKAMNQQEPTPQA